MKASMSLISCSLVLLAFPVASRAHDNMAIDPMGATQLRLGYMPVQLPFLKDKDKKPYRIVCEPSYRSKPKYAVISLGNGPKSKTLIALDEPEQGEYKIYIDANQNGDLTDDGDGSWRGKTERGGRTMYGVLKVLLNASYGSKTSERKSFPLGVAFYRFVGQDYLLCYRLAASTGFVNIDGKRHKAVLLENDADGLYKKPAASQEDLRKSRPVWLLIDQKGDGKLIDSSPIDIRSPFKIGDNVYEARVNDEGTWLSIRPTSKPILIEPKKPVERPALLAAGTAAPDFRAEKWGGGTLKLSDYKGQAVILDFWATWCGPCQRSMPHIEKVHQAVKSQGVAVIALCVWDSKEAYQKWVPENQAKYTFQFAFDPNGRGTESIASKLFKVSGIPTTYIIDKEGKVVDAIVGFGGEGDRRIEESLKKLGINIH